VVDNKSNENARPKGRDAQDRAPVRALDILETIAAQGPMTHSAIATATGVPKSTTTALLESLVSAGYLGRNPDRRFVLTGRILRLAAAYLGGQSWPQALQPILQSLSQESGASAFLVGEDGADIIVLARHLVAEGLTYALPIGARITTGSTAGGMAILAFRPDAPTTPEYDAIRHGALAFAPGRQVPGVVSYALPLRLGSGRPTSSLAVALPEALESSETLARVEAALRRAQQDAEALAGLRTP